MLTNILYFVIVLTIVVFIHELGHYIVAKKCGVKILEFSIGFGKKLFGKKLKNGEEWKVSLLPLGGYVKMFGDDNASGAFGYKDNPTEEDLKYSMVYKHPIKKILIAFAGPFMNIALAFVLFFCLFSIKGIHKIEPVITQIQAKSLAEDIGLKVNDKIVSINNYNIAYFQDIGEGLKNNSKNNELKMEIIRDGKNIKILKKDYKKGTLLGVIGDKVIYEKTDLFTALKYSFSELANITKVTCFGFLNMIIHHNTKNIGGPITIAKQSAKAGKNGIPSFVYFIALLSISLGVINLFPIPLLDGGYILFSFIELIIRRKIPNNIYKFTMYLGLCIVAFLMLVGIFNDLFIHK